jgi:hypothetical protein
MYSKRQLPSDLGNVEPGKRFRNNIADLFLSNDISAKRTQTIFSDAEIAGTAHVKQLAKPGSRGTNRNIHRDLLRKLSKNNKGWPPLYNARVRVFDPKKQKEVKTWLSFSLPHELLGAILSKSDATLFYNKDNWNDNIKHHMEFACAELGVQQLIPLGLWGDGCPCNWDRSQSIEVFTMNFPGLSGDHGNIRLPITAINKKFCVTHNTFDDILAIVAWSLRFCALGKYPSSRHSGAAFRPSDNFRRRRAGKDLGGQAVLAEIRGDWAFLKDCFRMPGWNEKSGCCWRCRVRPDEIRNASSAAPWRSERLSHWDLMQMMIAKGHGICPLFSAPCIRSWIFQIDWLHTVDLGVAQDFLGNLFKLCLPKMDGRNLKARCANLFLLIQEYYRRKGVENKLDNLTLTMIYTAKKAPKLKTKGAETRGLIDFAVELSNTFLADNNVVEHTAKHAAIALSRCYQCLSSSSHNHELLASSCKQFCLLYVALEATAIGKLWRVKPKLHLFQELCEMSTSRPVTCWTYRDEDFGGTMSRMSRRRGGRNSPYSTARSLLLKFVARHGVPRIVRD